MKGRIMTSVLVLLTLKNVLGHPGENQIGSLNNGSGIQERDNRLYLITE